MRSDIPPLLFFLSSLLLPNILYADSNKEGLGQLRDRIETLRKDLSDKEESKSGLSDSLHESGQAIAGINQKLVNLKEERHEVENRLSQLQIELDVIQNKILDQQTHLEKLFYQQYIGGEHKYFRLLLAQKDPNQISRELYYYGHISRTRTEDINMYRADLEKLRAIADEANKKTTEIISIQTKQAGQKKILEQEEIKYKELLAGISKEVAKGRSEILKLKRDEKSLSLLVNKIINNKNRSLKADKENLQNASLDEKDFKRKKGKLNLPVDGKIVNSFGSQKKGGVTWRGLFISAPVGIDVIAIADGKVVYADWIRGFGNVLIVDHGGDYMSLYGNNKILTKKVDETVHGGDIIAAVGNSDSNLDSGLYFELSHEGKPFDPLKWIRLD
jgi:septal ring factor EnvC (AmiA/AmiB activator)